MKTIVGQWKTLQDNGRHCNVHIKTIVIGERCSVFHCLAVSFGVLQCIAVTDTRMLGLVWTKTIVINACGSVLQYVAVHCSAWQ